MAAGHLWRALQPQVPQRDDRAHGRAPGAVEVRRRHHPRHQGLEADALQKGMMSVCLSVCLYVSLSVFVCLVKCNIYIFIFFPI